MKRKNFASLPSSSSWTFDADLHPGYLIGTHLELLFTPTLILKCTKFIVDGNSALVSSKRRALASDVV